MSIADVINYLENHLDKTDITLHYGATDRLINQFETTFGVKLPDDIKQFYKFANGFESSEDLFNIVRLEEIIGHRDCDKPDIYIAEYMIYCDMWGLEINPNNHNEYTIFNIGADSKKIVLTNSFAEFLQRFLNGGVFDGLYNWREEIKRNRISNP